VGSAGEFLPRSVPVAADCSAPVPDAGEVDLNGNIVSNMPGQSLCSGLVYVTEYQAEKALKCGWERVPRYDPGAGLVAVGKR
jgi:hypothetical protein